MTSSLLPTRLRCEYLTNPLGLGTPNPRLFWQLTTSQPLTAPEPSARQTAYELQVASSPDLLAARTPDLWDTGIVESNRSAHIQYAGQPLSSRARCWWAVRVRDGLGAWSSWSETSHFTLGLLHPDDWSAQWIGIDEPNGTAFADDVDPTIPPESRLASPRELVRRFRLDTIPEFSVLYITALGLYHARLNNTPVTDALLTPEWTNYHRRVQYQTYDVTRLLREGDNELTVSLANGWYCGAWQHWQKHLRRIYGEQPLLLLQLEVTGRDGVTQCISSDGHWRGTTRGPRRLAGIYEGETYDARITPPFPTRPIRVHSPGAGQLVSQPSEPIRITQRLSPVSIHTRTPGVHVIDFGQNLVGRCRVTLRESAGTLITLRHGEVLSPDGNVYLDNLHAGKLSQGDRQVDRYICSGHGEETFAPLFTYHGFRYVQLTGMDAPPRPEDITAEVFHTDMIPAGEFRCSHEGINRLVQNIRWSQRGNFMGVPTDCPQRDERCGYSGDANFFINTAVYLYDVAAFFSKWLTDLCQDSQRDDHGFADHAPDYGMGGSRNVGWSDGGILCPYRIYRTYGDTRLLERHYPAMRRNLLMQLGTSKDGLRGPDHVGNGDWLHLGGNASLEVIGTAHLAHCCSVMSEIAGALGHHSDAQLFATEHHRSAQAFAAHLITPDGHIKDSSQTGHALAWTVGLVPPDQQPAVRRSFANEIARFDHHLATGFIGTPRLLPALVAAGLPDLAYRLLLNDTLPSWLYPLRHDATTIWERWDSQTDAGFADPAMNSFNHYAFGSVGEFLFRHVAGLSEIEPGYQTYQVAPVPPPHHCSLTWAQASYQSPHGPIQVRWTLEQSRFTLTVSSPPNTTALLKLPPHQAGTLLVNGVAVAAAPSELAPGQYRFELVLENPSTRSR